MQKRKRDRNILQSPSQYGSFGFIAEDWVPSIKEPFLNNRMGIILAFFEINGERCRGSRYTHEAQNECSFCYAWVMAN